MTAPLTQYGLPLPAAEERDGTAVYGDNFDAAQIAIWFGNEQQGFYQLAETLYQPAEGEDFESLASDTYHFYRHLGARQFDLCLALGCGDALDVAQLAPRVGRFIAIEPAQDWWRDEIGGRPASYRQPQPDGTLDLPDASVDLITVYSVLHHIPNVSRVLGELARVLKPGGLVLLREPVVSMGDFTVPRFGLTAHERGIPSRVLEAAFTHNGLVVRRRAFFRTNAFIKALTLIGLNANTRLAVRLDALVSRILTFNLRYWRRHLLDRLSPSSAAYVLEKA